MIFSVFAISRLRLFRYISYMGMALIILIFSSINHHVLARSIMDVLFGPKEESDAPKPEQTLQAPFGGGQSGNGTSSTSSKLMDLYGKDQNTQQANMLDMDQPHMSSQQVADWGGDFVAQALSLNPDGWDNYLRSLNSNFSNYGWKEYTGYLQKTQILSTLQSSHTRMQAIADGVPQVIKEGVVDGNYSWLVQVPVIASFYDRAVEKFSDVRPSSIHNQKMILQVQITRTEKKDANIQGVEITRWVVSGAQ